MELTKDNIMDRIEEIQEICYQRNTGLNESDLDIRETLSDWILALIEEIIEEHS